ncbi:uncharacterized protein CC84DRAFT_1261554 [Paraphaeosphaeria sporulosa]|uniref:Uncharacterized protein n=1 Tax=Paraphaeosphaeria sporulosa TaxID=1460663 RepID=A0A177C5H9_9PLEO|nr:uncharacterized protein CC84DRAFT_1261554 [Paraphaeosphaeria sporulosa]OAG02873.1 hypothetical protein CC84DRAFT_1261554 [Paraphaeosphaeria sporulosa]
MESDPSLPLRTHSLTTAFSDLETYRSTSSGSSSTMDSHGPAPLPPRTASMPNYTADLELEMSSLAESSHTVRKANRLSLTASSEGIATESESAYSTGQHELFFEAPRIAPVVNVEHNNWFAPCEWSPSPPVPPEASLTSAASPRKFRHTPFNLIRSASKKRPSKKVADQQDPGKPRDKLWHSNRTKGAQAQRLIAKRKEVDKERKNKENYERYKKLERRLEANGFLTSLGKRGDERNT